MELKKALCCIGSIVTAIVALIIALCTVTPSSIGDAMLTVICIMIGSLAGGCGAYYLMEKYDEYYVPSGADMADVCANNCI